MRVSEYSTKAEDFQKNKHKRPTITELVLHEKQKKEVMESGKPVHT
jgi:hypothetical protein